MMPNKKTRILFALFDYWGKSQTGLMTDFCSFSTVAFLDTRSALDIKGRGKFVAEIETFFRDNFPCSLQGIFRNNYFV